MSSKGNAIDISRISGIGQYKIQVCLIENNNPPSPYVDIAEFTIKDKDEFGMYLLWIIISALIGASAGAFVGTRF